MLAVTGHRPQVIAGAMMLRSLTREDADRLLGFARRKIILDNPATAGVGMALGWDMACALACAQLTIPFTAYIPFEGQERLWSGADQKLYRGLLARASQVIVVCKHRLDVAYHTRNERLIDDSTHVLAFYSGARGGTQHAVEYAESWLRPIKNVWPEWLALNRGYDA